MGCCEAPGLMPIEEAMPIILENTQVVRETERLAIEVSVGRVLAQDLTSPLDVPPFDNSAMDGYAIRIADLEYSSTMLLAGKSFAGSPFNGVWSKGSCVRVMTGAQIPKECDAIIMQEDVTAQGEVIQFNIEFAAVKPLQHIRPTGDDIKKGQLVLEKGRRLTARDLPMLASLGISMVEVYRKPLVAMFSTGDELKAVGSELQAGEIYDSNRYGMRPLFDKFGCKVIDLGIIPDDEELLTQAFEKAKLVADVVVTSGGVSVGEADYTKDILEQQGEISFWKLAIKPGKPFAFGKLDRALFCGLPGNPVSAFVTSYVLVQPLIAKLSGESQWTAPPILSAISKSAFKKRSGRTDYQRAIFSVNQDGQLEVESTGNQSSGAFCSVSLANCFAILERERGYVEVGETVQIQPFSAVMY